MFTCCFYVTYVLLSKQNLTLPCIVRVKTNKEIITVHNLTKLLLYKLIFPIVCAETSKATVNIFYAFMIYKTNTFNLFQVSISQVYTRSMACPEPCTWDMRGLRGTRVTVQMMRPGYVNRRRKLWLCM